jgi:hypothetical protein
LPSQAKRNRFAGQIQLNLLFDLLLVIDVACREINPAERDFSKQELFLLKSAGHSLSQSDFQEAHRQFSLDFEASLLAALDATLISGSSPLDRLQRDVHLAYELRNRGAHEVDTCAAIWEDFDRVQRAIFRVLCATVDFLY